MSVEEAKSTCLNTFLLFYYFFHALHHNAHSTKKMNENIQSEVEVLKTSICFKEHEIFTLRSELERRNQEYQMLMYSIERLEKTTAAHLDRLFRKIDRLTHPVEPEQRFRRRRRGEDGR